MVTFLRTFSDMGFFAEGGGVHAQGWPLLLVETEVNGDSKSTNERGPSLIGWACRAVKRYICSALVALVGPVKK
jgi:hypothetical protein